MPSCLIELGPSFAYVTTWLTSSLLSAESLSLYSFVVLFIVRIFYFKNGVLAILSFAFFSSSSWCSTSSKLPQRTTMKRSAMNARIFFMALSWQRLLPRNLLWTAQKPARSHRSWHSMRPRLWPLLLTLLVCLSRSCQYFSLVFDFKKAFSAIILVNRFF